MFKKHSEEPRKRRKKSPIMGLFRTFLSLIMISVLGLGVYSAYRSFSGVDPLQIDPKTALSSLVKSDSSYSFLSKLLSFSPSSLPGLNKLKLPGQSNNQPPVVSSDQAVDPSSLFDNSSQTLVPTPRSTPSAPLQFKFAVMGDSHNDNDDLKKALAQAKSAGARFVVGLGDYTDVGTVDELTKAKQVFIDSGLPYYLLPGDHDLWDSRNRSLPALADFNQVVGPNDYQSFAYESLRVVMVDNSDDYLGLSQDQMNWVASQLANARTGPNTKLVMVFASTPFFHPSSDHAMGRVTPSLKDQATSLINQFSAASVDYILAGDTHFYSQYVEPRTGLKMIAVGAITADRNLQKPRYVMVDVYLDGSYNIEDTEVK